MSRSYVILIVLLAGLGVLTVVNLLERDWFSAAACFFGFVVCTGLTVVGHRQEQRSRSEDVGTD